MSTQVVLPSVVVVTVGVTVTVSEAVGVVVSVAAGVAAVSVEEQATSAARITVSIFTPIQYCFAIKCCNDEFRWAAK